MSPITAIVICLILAIAIIGGTITIITKQSWGG